MLSASVAGWQDEPEETAEGAERHEEVTAKFTTKVPEVKNFSRSARYQVRLEERPRFADERLESFDDCQSAEREMKVVRRAEVQELTVKALKPLFNRFFALSLNQREAIVGRLCDAVGRIMAAPRWSHASMLVPPDEGEGSSRWVECGAH